ncbi:MAG: phytanoyl-CoA dioxygenase family protein [Phycisphaeraceae bacterium]|nr:phytanoyl-CoA dioxygenase family protein [Phycisphaeraceae bacterium]
MITHLTDDQWDTYSRQGYLHLDQLLSDEQVALMQKRIDDIMLGKANVDYGRMHMQLDANSEDYGKLPPQTPGHKGATLDYRKIEQLEFDPFFLRYMQQPLFEDICRRQYGQGVSVRCFRAMFMNKPAGKGTTLPWHQDRWSVLDRDPLVTIWLAIDPATIANGCVNVIPGSHKTLLNPSHPSGFLTQEQASSLDTDKLVPLELKAGEAVLLHNWTLHNSTVNRSPIARRAFSVCYMDGRTKTQEGNQYWSQIFGDGAMNPDELELAAASR